MHRPTIANVRIIPDPNESLYVPGREAVDDVCGGSGVRSEVWEMLWRSAGNRLVDAESAVELSGEPPAVHLTDAAPRQLVDEVHLLRCGCRVQQICAIWVRNSATSVKRSIGRHDGRNDPLAQPLSGTPRDRAVGHCRGCDANTVSDELRKDGQPDGADRVVGPCQHPQHSRTIHGANVVGQKPARSAKRIISDRIAVALGQCRTAEHHSTVESIRTPHREGVIVYTQPPAVSLMP